MLTPDIQKAYTAILREELVPATGCTEPISLAYAAASLRETLGGIPQRILAEVSGNIVKNGKSVVVPNTGGLKGIQAAIAAGAMAGKADQGLQVISSIPKEQYPAIAAYAGSGAIRVACSDTPRLLDIRLTGWLEDHQALVHIANNHSNIVRIEKDGQVLAEKPVSDSPEDGLTDKSFLNLRNILKVEARAWAAAGSDARMSGCEMPVVIISGSGNQGMTASLPVIRYAKKLGATQEQLYRALLVSDLVTIYQKAGIGRLSAYCGAVSAGVGAGAGIAYLHGADFEGISQTIINAAAIISGTICDGAKPSCAAKIAAGVDAGILGYQMYRNGQAFHGGDGILAKDADSTIANIGVLAKQGMQETDRTILQIMTKDP